MFDRNNFVFSFCLMALTFEAKLSSGFICISPLVSLGLSLCNGIGKGEVYLCA